MCVNHWPVCVRGGKGERETVEREREKQTTALFNCHGRAAIWVRGLPEEEEEEKKDVEIH